ncbi:hypothetical protein D3C85_1595130 [compost metagenome]
MAAMASTDDTMNNTSATPSGPDTLAAYVGTAACSASSDKPIRIVAMMPMPEIGLADEPTRPAM